MGLFGFGKKKERKHEKKFRLQAGEIKDIATGHGGCIASDRITVDGFKVGFMYRKKNDQLSGWVFLSGEESQDYLDDPGHLDVYDINTIANYDPEIIPLLEEPVGSAFARKDGGKLLGNPLRRQSNQNEEDPGVRDSSRRASVLRHLVSRA